MLTTFLVLWMSAQTPSLAWTFMDHDGTVLMTCNSRLHPGGEFTPTNCKIEPGKSLDDLANAWTEHEKRDYVAHKATEQSWGSEGNGGDGSDREHFLIHPQAADETDGKTPTQIKVGATYPIGEAKPLTKDSPKTYACTDHPEYFPQVPLCHPAEPMDVPAVQEPTREPPDCRMEAFTGGEYDGWHIPSRWNDMCTSEKPLATTCADKSRILLTSENGTAHCIKFPEAK